MHINIQTKLFILLAGLTAIVLFGVLWAINTTLSSKIREKIIGDFQQTQTIFQKEQALRYDRLVETASLIGENSVFKANLSLNDPATVYFSVEEFSLLAKVDLFIVTNRQGTVLARLDVPEEFGNDLTQRSTVKRVLEGEFPEINLTTPDLWYEDGALYQVVSVPIYTRQESILGTITLGTMITEVEATELKGESDIDISFLLGDTLIASTIDSTQRDFVARLISDKKADIQNAIQTLSAGTPFEWNDTNVDLFAFISHLGQGANAYYMATVPKSIELSILNELQQNILLMAAISLVLTLIIAYLLGKNFSKPILKLVEGMNFIKQGNLNVSVKPQTHDEIGLLTQTFNDMIVGLRERLHLTKYVGTHTMDMIKQASGTEVSLGGERKNITVLFSDVRAFTAYSEKHTPEQVIAMLNRYLGIQAELVDLHGGSVDKFVGDEMLALFIGDDSIQRAMRCAIQIQKVVQKDRQEHQEELSIGIGINHGSVVIGNMGALDRMDYTVIGDAVNLGSRLCSAAQGDQILMPKSCITNGNKFVLGDSNFMTFKGISEPIEIVEVRSEV